MYNELLAERGINLPAFDDISKPSNETAEQLSKRRELRTANLFNGLHNGDWYFTAKEKKNPWTLPRKGGWSNTEPVALLLRDSFVEWADRVEGRSAYGVYIIDFASAVMMPKDKGVIRPLQAKFTHGSVVYF